MSVYIIYIRIYRFNYAEKYLLKKKKFNLKNTKFVLKPVGCL